MATLAGLTISSMPGQLMIKFLVSFTSARLSAKATLFSYLSVLSLLTLTSLLFCPIITQTLSQVTLANVAVVVLARTEFAHGASLVGQMSLGPGVRLIVKLPLLECFL